MTNLVGTTLGQYQIVELIGEGGMASVYKAWQPSLRRYVALKVLAPHLADEAGFVKRFEHEAAAAANLKHTHIVTIHDVGTENGYHYIAMEFIEGTSLEERIRSGGAVAPEQVVEIISQVGSALDYAHQRGFIHRDIKPANVLMDAAGRAVLTDFGIAKAVSGSGISGPPTRAGSIFGTPHYMSPEQVKEEPLDHRTDLYALGIVCYEMLTGEVPFDATTTHSILYAQAHTPPPPLSGVNPAVPAPVEAVVNRMLAKERGGRYDSAGEFAMALAQAVAGVWPEEGGEATLVGAGVPTGAAVMETLPGAEAVTPRRRRAPARRRRWPLVLGAAVVGVLLIVGAILAVVVLRGRGDSLETRLAEAQAALADGRYEEAIGTLKEVLEEDEDNVAALRGMGEAHEAQEQWQAAAEWYEKWTQVVPDDPEGQLKMGWAYYHAEEYEKAIAGFTRLIALEPANVEGYKGKGLSYYAMEQYQEALQPLKTWVEMEASNPRAWHVLGWVYYWLEDYENAVVQFRQVTELQADWAEGWYGLAKSHFKAEEYGEAIDALVQWIELEPENAEAHRMLGWSYSFVGEYSSAIEEFELALSFQPEWSDVYFGMGNTYYRMEDYVSAESNLGKSVELDPDKAAAYGSLGWSQYHQGKYKQALQSFERALSLRTQVSFLAGAGAASRELGDYAEEIRYFKQYVELAPDSYEAYVSLGWAYFHHAQYEDAIVTFVKAATLAPDKAGAYVGEGMSYEKLGDCEKAIESFETALERDPGNGSAQGGLKRCGQ